MSSPLQNVCGASAAVDAGFAPQARQQQKARTVSLRGLFGFFVQDLEHLFWRCFKTKITLYIENMKIQPLRSSYFCSLFI